MVYHAHVPNVVLLSHQSYRLYRGTLKPPYGFSPGPETLETGLYAMRDIPFDEIAFSAIRVVLQQLADDLDQGSFRVHEGVRTQNKSKNGSAYFCPRCGSQFEGYPPSLYITFHSHHKDSIHTPEVFIYSLGPGGEACRVRRGVRTQFTPHTSFLFIRSRWGGIQGAQGGEDSNHVTEDSIRVTED